MTTRRSVVPRYLRPKPRRVAGLAPSIWSAVVVVGFFVFVELLVQSGAVSPFKLVPVSTMATTAFELLGDSKFLVNDLLRSVIIIVVSFVAASVLGVVVAYAMWRSGICRRSLSPYLNVFYAVPTFAMYPILVVLFGTGSLPIIALTTAFGVVVVILNSLNGFNAVPDVVRKLATTLGMGRAQYFKKILLPAAMPDIAAGLKLCMAYSVIAALAMEFILSTQGLGHFISYSYDSFATKNMYGAVLIVALLALVANIGLTRLLSGLDWRRR